MYESLIHAFRQSSPSDERYRQRADRYRYLSEWVALHNIPANQIQRATRYERDTENRGIVAVGQPRQNPRYQRRPTHANADPFNAGAINGDDVYAVPSNFNGLLTSCFAFCARSESKRRNADSDTCPTPPVIFNISMSADMSTVWDPILNRAVEHVVPWVEVRRYRGLGRKHVQQLPSDCFIDPGARDDLALLQVFCPPSDFYREFVVLLKAGGSWNDWVDQMYTNIPTNQTWRKWSREIPMVDTNSNLEDNDYTVQDVFLSGSGWRSEIKVIPIYPLYHDV